MQVNRLIGIFRLMFCRLLLWVFFSFSSFFLLCGVCLVGIVIFLCLERYLLVSELGWFIIWLGVFFVIIWLLCMLVFGLMLMMQLVSWIVFLLCLIMIIVLLRLCRWVRVLSRCLLLCWCRLIEGLLRMYIIFIRLVLIWLVRWMCWVLLLDRVLVLWLRVRQLRLMLIRNCRWLWIFLRIFVVILLWWLVRLSLVVYLQVLLIGIVVIVGSVWLLIYICCVLWCRWVLW